MITNDAPGRRVVPGSPMPLRSIGFHGIAELVARFAMSATAPLALCKTR
jgi:hypothetical protein